MIEIYQKKFIFVLFFFMNYGILMF